MNNELEGLGDLGTINVGGAGVEASILLLDVVEDEVNALGT